MEDKTITIELDRSFVDLGNDDKYIYFDYKEDTKNKAYEKVFKLVKLLTEEGYACIIKDEGLGLVVQFADNYDKAEEYGSATFVQLDLDTYNTIKTAVEDSDKDEDDE